MLVGPIDAPGIFSLPFAAPSCTLCFLVEVISGVSFGAAAGSRECERRAASSLSGVMPCLKRLARWDEGGEPMLTLPLRVGFVFFIVSHGLARRPSSTSSSVWCPIPGSSTWSRRTRSSLFPRGRTNGRERRPSPLRACFATRFTTCNSKHTPRFATFHTHQAEGFQTRRHVPGIPGSFFSTEGGGGCGLRGRGRERWRRTKNVAMGGVQEREKRHGMEVVEG